MMASNWPLPNGMGRDRRTSHEKNALSLRRVLRWTILPSAHIRSETAPQGLIVGLARAGCRGRLSRIVAYAIVEEYIAGQFGKGPQIEAVALVAV